MDTPENLPWSMQAVTTDTVMVEAVLPEGMGRDSNKEEGFLIHWVSAFLCLTLETDAICGISVT